MSLLKRAALAAARTVMLVVMSSGLVGGLPGAGGRAAEVRDGALDQGGDARSRVVARCVIPRVMLAAAIDGEPAVLLGGISDLFLEPVGRSGAGGTRRAWVVTDRGPNGTIEIEGVERRTLAAASFAPRIIELAIEWNAERPERLGVRITGMTQLTDHDGRPLSGRPNGLTNDPAIVDPRVRSAIEADPHGVDPEGLVRTRDDRFWLAEEYRPSLLAVAADGTAERRFVPAGDALPGSGMDVIDCLPTAYAGRRDNRGFEALAIAPDETRIFALLQSPLDGRDPAEARGLGNVRLLAFDPATGRPVAEHLYRLGDPEERGYTKGKAAPDDGKLCAMAAIGPASLVVLEQADGGVARLYRVDLAGATDTLPRTAAGEEPPLESLREPRKSGVVPVAKTLLADLGPLLDEMRADAAMDGTGDRRPLKIEGLAVADDHHVVLVNDDDFGVRKDADDDPAARTCLWVVRLAAALPLTQP
jgi:hypothetical protein